MVGGQGILGTGTLATADQNMRGTHLVLGVLEGFLQKMVTHLRIHEILLCGLRLIGGQLVFELRRRVHLQGRGLLHLHPVVDVKVQILTQILFGGFTQRIVFLISIQEFVNRNTLLANADKHVVVCLGIEGHH